MKKILVTSLFLLQVPFISASESNVEKRSLLQVSSQKEQQQMYDDTTLEQRVKALEADQRASDYCMREWGRSITVLLDRISEIEKVIERARGVESRSMQNVVERLCVVEQKRDVESRSMQNMEARLQNIVAEREIELRKEKIDFNQTLLDFSQTLLKSLTEVDDKFEGLRCAVRGCMIMFDNFKTEHDDANKQLQTVAATVKEHKKILEGEQGLVAFEGKLKEEQVYLQSVVQGLSDQLKALESKHTTKESRHNRVYSDSSEDRSFGTGNILSKSVDRANNSDRGTDDSYVLMESIG